MNLYKEGIGSLCRVEQDLATGTDKDGEPIDDPLKVMMASIFDRKVRSVGYCMLLFIYWNACDTLHFRVSYYYGYI